MLWTLTKTESNLHISQNKSYISLQWHKYTFLFQKGRIAGVELSSVSVCLVGMKSWIQFLVQKQNLKGKNRRIGRINPKWDQTTAGYNPKHCSSMSVIWGKWWQLWVWRGSGSSVSIALPASAYTAIFLSWLCLLSSFSQETFHFSGISNFLGLHCSDAGLWVTSYFCPNPYSTIRKPQCKQWKLRGCNVSA